MKKLVYDLPLRLFHWLFAFYFVFAFVIAKTVDSESLTYSYHMMAGLTLGFAVLLRLVWGFIGSRHSQFKNFELHPQKLIQYGLNVFKKNAPIFSGHNPASSWAALVMFTLTFGLVITGFLMTSTPDKEKFEDIHEIFANTFILVVIAHIAGIVIHTVKHKDLIGLSMLSGRKNKVADHESITKSYAWVGFIFIILIIGFNVYIGQNFNTETRKLNIFNTTLNLGE